MPTKVNFLSITEVTVATPDDLHSLQQQIDDLAARVTALEEGQEPPPPPTDRVVYNDPSQIVGGMAYIIATGETEIVNHEFANMAAGDGNGAGIRMQGGHLVVRDSWFHDGQEGILTGNLGTEEVEIYGSRFERLGYGGQAHGVYCGINKSLVAKDSVFLSGKGEGHEFKCRAAAQLHERNIYASLLGEDSRCLDAEQGNLTLRNVVFQKGAQSSNEDFILIGLVAAGSIVIDNAIFLNDSGRPAILVRAMKGSPVTIRNAIVVGPMHPITGPVYMPNGGPAPVMENVQFFATRAEAGFAPYDETEASIPWPAGWGERPGDLAGVPSGVPTVSLTAPATVVQGGAVRLDWTTQNAGAAYASGSWLGPKPLAGSEVIQSVHSDAAYTLTAVSRSAKASRTANVSVVESPPPGPVDLDNLPKGQWTEIPDTKMETVFPAYHGETWGGGPANVIAAWNGGALDPETNRLYLWGGGHEDYGGNEVYCFDLEAMRWTRVNDPSPVKEWLPSGSLAQAYAIMQDGPTAVHTYGNLAWAGNTRRFFTGGAYTYRAAGAPTSWWQFDPAAIRWEQLPGPFPMGPSDYMADRAQIAILANEFVLYDPMSHQVVARHPNPLPDWGFGISNGGYGGGFFLTMEHHGAIILYDLRGTPTPHLLAINPELSPSYGFQQIPPPHPPPGEIRAMGIAWSPPAGKFVLWAGQGRTAWTFDPVARVFEELPNLVGPTPPPARSNGVYGRWRYVAKYDCFIGVNDSVSNVWLYRLA
jgi:hypothetical protein